MHELSETSKQLQRLAMSLGFDDAFEAQTAIDTVGLNLIYREFIETIRAQEADIKLLRKELKLVQKENVALKQELKMHGLKTFPLDADTTGYLFTFLQDLPSLISTNLSCRFLYEVFKAGSQAITRAVALNQIGPMLPQALRLARIEARSLHRVDVGNLPKEDSALSVGITGRESVILARNAKTVFELENLFSWKKKDRRSKISVLTNRESLHFQRVLYRIMLISFVHGMRSISEPELVDDLNFRSSRPKQQEFLEEYSNSELYQIQRVVYFLLGLAHIRLSENHRLKVSLESGYHLNDLILFMGPCFILQCYTYRNSLQTMRNYCEVPFQGFIIQPLRTVLAYRSESQDIDSPHGVLDSIYGVDDKCAQCGGSGRSLVNNTCWSDLKGLLHDTLFSWYHELLSTPIEIELQETLLNLDLCIFMDTLFDARSSSYSSWRKDEWICTECLSSLWLDTLSIWWLKQKREGRHYLYSSV